MALIRRRVTPRMLEANRRNVARSTGPHTEGGKFCSRLSRLRHGERSALATQYFRLSWDVWMTARCEPRPRHACST